MRDLISDDPLARPASASGARPMGAPIPTAGAGLDEARRSVLRFFRFLGRRWWVLILVTAGLGYAIKSYADGLPRTYGCTPVVIELVLDHPTNSESLESYEYAAASLAFTVVPTQQAVLGTGYVLDPVVEELALEGDPDYASLGGRVATTVSLNTSLISLTVQGPRPEMNAKIANAIARRYAALRKEERERFLNDRLTESTQRVEVGKADLKEAERAAQAWREANQTVNVEADSDIARVRVSNVFSALKTAEAARDEADAAEAQVLAAEQAKRDVGEVGVVRDDPDVRRALDELRRLEQQAEQLELTKIESDPTRLLTRSLLENQRRVVAGLMKGRAEDLKTAARTARQRAEKLSAELDREEKNLTRLIGLGVEAAGHDKVQEQARRALAEAQLEERRYKDLQARQKDPVRVREEARPSGAIVSPKLSVIYLGGGILAIVVAIVLALLLDLVSTRLRDPEEIHRIAGAPFLGVVPMFKAKHGAASPSRLVLEETDGVTSEAYRLLAATALLHGGTGEPPKTFAVTSPHSGDGKTTTAIGLSVALARRGGKVLLVDADLRKPDLHHVLEDAVEPGLTMLFATGRSVWDAVRRVEVSAEGHDTVRFDVLTAGVLPPNPADLLSGPRMQGFLKEARARYDAVVIDTPPVNLVSDACLLAPYVDGFVFVIRDGRTHRGPFHRAISRVRAVRGMLLGVLVNAARSNRAGGYGYGYGSGYGYGYGYGYGKKAGAHAAPAGAKAAAAATGDAGATNGSAEHPTKRNGRATPRQDGAPAVTVRVLPASPSRTPSNP